MIIHWHGSDSVIFFTAQSGALDCGGTTPLSGPRLDAAPPKTSIFYNRSEGSIKQILKSIGIIMFRFVAPSGAT